MGLVVGFVLRGQFQNRKMIPFVLGFLPWLVHILYVVMYVQRSEVDVSNLLLIFLSISVLIAVGVFWVGLRSLQRGGRTIVFTPLLLVGLYGLGPLLWFSSVLRAEAIGTDSIPTVMLVGGALFVTSMLFVFSLNLFRRGSRASRGKS